MKRILSIDGGGIRGLIPAAFLAALEAVAGRPAETMFDMLAGTSTGGIIAVGLLASLPASDLVRLYAERGPSIFPRPSFLKRFEELRDPIYDAAPLEAALFDLLGNAWLGETGGPELLVPAYAVSIPDSFFFKSWLARADAAASDGHDFLLRDIARATSAAPIYFPRAAVESMAGDRYEFIDGGVFANNPATCAIADARSLWPGEELLVVSIGTGAIAEPVDLGSGGLIDVGPKLPDIFMDGSAGRADHEARAALGDAYRRFQVDLAEPLADGRLASAAMDDASPENLAALAAVAARLAARSDLPALAKLLGAC